MIKFTVGDKIRCVCSRDEYHKDYVGEVGSVVDLVDSDPTLYFVSFPSRGDESETVMYNNEIELETTK